MEFEWLMTAAPQTNVMKSRRPRLPASTKVNRICGNLTTSHRLKVRTLTEGCGRVQVAGGRADWPMSLFVLVFGRRHDEPFHALWRPASKKRQGTKSPEVGHWLAASRPPQPSNS